MAYSVTLQKKTPQQKWLLLTKYLDFNFNICQIYSVMEDGEVQFSAHHAGGLHQDAR
jgi:hypothetical protein